MRSGVHRSPAGAHHHRATSLLMAAALVGGALAGGALAGGALAGCASTAVPPAASAVEWAERRLPLAPCAQAGPEVREHLGEGHEALLCGSYPVYEDREAAAGRQIELFVAVAPALTRTPEPDPLFFFMGGPGGSAAEGAAAMAAQPPFSELRRRRDLVLVDQRGTGLSHPLDCAFGGTPDDPQGYFQPLMDRRRVVACRERLEQKADLSLYTTSIAIDDIDEIRRWLGYDRINAMGGSYGSRAVQVLLKRHPESVRTAILAWVVGMDQHIPLFHARDGKRGADLLLASCAAEAACNAAFPNIAGEFQEVIERLRRQPATVEVATGSGETATVELDAVQFAEASRYITYDADTAIYLPLLVHTAHGGDYRPFVELGRLWRHWLQETLYYGLWLSVTCAEDLPFITPEETRRATAGTYLGDHRVKLQKMACEEWPRGAIPDGFHDPVTADVPAMLVSGRLDPVTPPSWAEQVDRHLPRSRHLLVPHGHHGIEALANPECLDRLLLTFLDSGSPERLDDRCLAGMTRPAFVTDPAAVERFAELGFE